jgi:two-component sensor histidine kinase
VKYLYIITFLSFYTLLPAQTNTDQDSLEQEVLNSNGLVRCKQVIKLFRAFENHPDAGGTPFPESYLGYVDECIPIAEANNNIDVLNSLKISKAAILLRNHSFLAVFELISEVLTTQQPLNLYDSLDAYVFLSGAYFNMGMYEKSLESGYIKASLAKKLNRTDVVIEMTSEVAMIYFKMKVYELAAQNFKKLVSLYQSEKNYYMVAAHLNNLGLTYTGWHKGDSALYFFQQAKLYVENYYTQFDDEDGKNFFIGLLEGNMADVYIEKGQFSKGIKLLKRDIEVSKKVGDYKNIIITQVDLGKAYKLQKDYVNALAYLDSADRLSTEKDIKTVNNQISIGELKAHLFLEIGEFEKAANTFHSINELKDSLFSKENNNTALITNSVYQVYEKEKQLNIQKVILAETEVQHLNDVVLRNILYVVAVILLIFIGFILIARNKQRKGNSLLLSQNEKIEEQKAIIEANLNEKEVLLKEIQHRVKNNLQVISGMLQLQASYFDDPKMERAMEESQGRIKSMAIIHQQLYQNNDNLRYISFENYLKDLTTQIASTNKQTAFKVNIITHAENIQFDVKTAIPLGIIINELLTNAYKYAFNSQEKGEIHVSVESIDNHNFKLIVKDNGIGLPSDFDINKVNSLGLKLVRILSNQMKGSFDIGVGNGACFIINFRDNIV